MPKFAIVELNGEKTTLLPSIWLSNDRKSCLYPPENVKEHQERCSFPEANWLNYAITRIFCWTDSMVRTRDDEKSNEPHRVFDVRSLSSHQPHRKSYVWSKSEDKTNDAYNDESESIEDVTPNVKIEVDEEIVIDPDVDELNSMDSNMMSSPFQQQHPDSGNNVSLSSIYEIVQRTQQQNEMILSMLTNVQEEVERLKSQQHLFEVQVKRRLTNISSNMIPKPVSNPNRTSTVTSFPEYNNYSSYDYGGYEHFNNQSSIMPEAISVAEEHMPTTVMETFNNSSVENNAAVHHSANLASSSSPRPHNEIPYDKHQDKFGRMGKFPITSINDYYIFEKNLDDMEFYKAMKQKIFYLVVNFSHNHKSYYEYYRTALKLMFPMKLLYFLTMAPFTNRICLGKSRICKLIEESGESLTANELLDAHQRMDELKNAFRKLKDSNRRKRDVKIIQAPVI